MPPAFSAVLPEAAQAALRKDAFPKFAATVDAAGVPNVVPLLSASRADERTLVFVRMMLWKTARNLEANRKIAVNVIGPGACSWTIKGEFVEFVKSGPYLDYFNQKALFRYNAYAGAGEVGVIRVLETLGPFPLHLFSALFYGLLRGHAPANGHGHHPSVMPPQVQEKFDSRLGIKYLGWADDEGFPMALPCLDLHAASSDTLAFNLPRDSAHPLAGLAAGRPMAASVLTLAPVAYQVKGKLAGMESVMGRRVGVIQLEESYSAAPPVPGRRIFPPETF